MSLSAVCALAYEDVESDKQNVAVELVTGLGIMEPDSDTNFGGSTLVKRGEMALYITRLMGYDVKQSSNGRGYFEDVDTSTPEGAAVEFLASSGAIPKSGREYNPNDEATYVEAVRIILNCMGYGQVAKSCGGYPGGYLKTATDCELNKNVKMMTNSVMSKVDTAVLLYNAMFVYPMENLNNEYKKSDKTFLETSLDLYEVNGVVSGYENTYIGADTELPQNSVEINGEIFDAGVSGIDGYVGYNVNAYYREDRDGSKTIVAFSEKKNANKVYTFAIDDIEVKDNKVTYDENSRRKTLKVSESAAVIYNGRYYSKYSSLEEALDIAEGEVTFIANNSTDKCNVIIVKEYNHLLVERVDKRGGRLYLKNGSANESADPYLPSVVTVASSDIDCTVYMDGKEISFNDLQPNDAVTMEKNMDGDEIKLYVSRNVVSGKITSVSNDKLKINGEKYDLSKYSTDVLTNGTEGNFAITTDGKFLGLVEVVHNGSNDYAYVLDVYCEEGPEKAYVELFTAQGQIETFECTGSLKVNGVKKTYSEIPNVISKSEIVTYKVKNDGTLSYINRPYDASTKLDYINETEFIKNWNKSSVRYTDGIMGMSFITEDTVIFSMPRFDRDKESDYQILKASDLENRTYSDVTCYDVDRQGRAGAVLIVEDITDKVSMGDSLFFVKEVNTACNEDDDIVYRVDGYQDGKEVTLDFTEDTDSVTYEDGWINYVGNEDFDTGYQNLNVGDALQYTLDNEGNVGAYRLVFNNAKTIINAEGKVDYDNANNFFEDWSGTGSVTKQDFYDDLYIAFGDVQLRYMDYMVVLGLDENDRLSYESSTNPIRIIDYYRPINLLNAPVYLYYVNSDELELGDMEDVLKSDVVFVRSKKMGEKNEIMVYVEE